MQRNRIGRWRNGKPFRYRFRSLDLTSSAEWRNQPMLSPLYFVAWFSFQWDPWRGYTVSPSAKGSICVLHAERVLPSISIFLEASGWKLGAVFPQLAWLVATLHPLIKGFSARLCITISENLLLWRRFSSFSLCLFNSRSFELIRG